MQNKLAKKNKLVQESAAIKIALLGFGLDNRSLLDLMIAKKIPADITICDARDLKPITAASKNLTISYQLGNKFNKNLDRFDILFRSPGWPLSCPGIRAAQKIGKTEITSPLNLFLALCPTKKIIGVTGSKGKGTTASLIYKILKDSGQRVWLGGNIGVSPLSFLTKIKPSDYVVLELSSFQLEDAQYSCQIAVITNLFKEHLAPADPHNPNFHPSYSSYWRAKLNIAKNPENKHLVINNNLAALVKTEKINGRISFFSASKLKSGLVGDFNRENIGAAVAVSKILKIPATSYQRTIEKFNNLEHRLEFVERIDGVDYYDNSFSTTPESTVLDLKSFQSPIVLIAGGADKGANFKDLARAIKERVKFLILLAGQATPRIKEQVLKINFPDNKMVVVDSMAKAVKIAKSQSVSGDTVLLSTACASFGLFQNYKDRGDQFKRFVRAKK